MYFPYFTVQSSTWGRQILKQNLKQQAMKVSKHGSYNLEKVLNFSSRLKKSWNSVKVLEKYLISLLGLEKSLEFTTLSMPDTYFLQN